MLQMFNDKKLWKYNEILNILIYNWTLEYYIILIILNIINITLLSFENT